MEAPAPTEIPGAVFIFTCAANGGLVAQGVIRYEKAAQLFIDSLAGHGEIDWPMLSGREVSSFMLAECVGRGGSSARNLAAGLRSFLQPRDVEGLTPVGLAAAVPSCTGLAGSIASGRDRAWAERLLECCDRGRATGRRDYAIFPVLVRLGWGRRGGREGLEDLDWRGATVVPKGRRDEPLPLPVDVGEALAEYLRRDARRPRVGACSCGGARRG